MGDYIMNKKAFMCFVLCLGLSVILLGCSTNDATAGGEESQSQGEKRVFKLGHIGADTHVWTGMLEVFNDELQENSDGRLSIEVFANASLGNEPDLMRQMKSGTLDMAWVTSAELTNRSSSFNAWYMPFLLESV